MNLAAQPISFGLRAGAPLDNIGGNVNHWEFPILVKYRFSGAPLIHPYLAPVNSGLSSNQNQFEFLVGFTF